MATTGNGSVRWIKRLVNGRGVLAITPKGGKTQEYTLRMCCDGVVLGKADGTQYHLACSRATGNYSCDCKDAEYRPGRVGGCKHAGSVKAALASLKNQS